MNKEVIISVQELETGYTIEITKSRRTLLYPVVKIMYNEKVQETEYIVENSPDDIVTGKVFLEVRDNLESKEAETYLEIAQLVHIQKLRNIKEEIERYISEIFTL